MEQLIYLGGSSTGYDYYGVINKESSAINKYYKQRIGEQELFPVGGNEAYNWDFSSGCKLN